MTGQQTTAQLTLGPVLFNWPAERWRDFYYQIADEAPVETVYLGEVVCYKRAPLFDNVFADVAERLIAANKAVVFSTLAEVMAKQERDLVKRVCDDATQVIEANDASALALLRGRPHHVGPFVNAYNEHTLALLARNGARNICLPPELPGTSIATLASAAAEANVTLEVQVFGRIPLALSARCYHARAHGRTKDTCQFVCEQDSDGMTLRTLDNKPFLVVNGIQTMSYTYLNLLGEICDLQRRGVRRLRLSPHSGDMIAVARAFRDTLDGRIDAQEATARIGTLGLDAPFANGFHHGKPGTVWQLPNR